MWCCSHTGLHHDSSCFLLAWRAPSVLLPLPVKAFLSLQPLCVNHSRTSVSISLGLQAPLCDPPVKHHPIGSLDPVPLTLAWRPVHPTPSPYCRSLKEIALSYSLRPPPSVRPASAYMGQSCIFSGCMWACSVPLFATPWTVALQAPPSMPFSQ